MITYNSFMLSIKLIAVHLFNKNKTSSFSELNEIQSFFQQYNSTHNHQIYRKST